MSFFAYDSTFTGGVRVASGDVNGDGIGDIITGPGVSGGPNVRVFSGATMGQPVSPTLLQNFFAYEPTFTGGVFVSAGKLGTNGLADIITGPGAGRAPEVKAFDG